MYYKNHVEPLLTRLTKNDGGASTSSGDYDGSYGDDEYEKKIEDSQNLFT